MANTAIFTHALEIATAQASVRTMTASEVIAYAQEIAHGLENIIPQTVSVESMEKAQFPAIDPKNSIKENSVTCIECGQTFKVLSIYHLRLHGLDAKSYRKKWGISTEQPLVCKALVRERRRQMTEHKIWEQAPFYGKKDADVEVKNKQTAK